MQLLSHRDDPVRHRPDVVLPLLEQRWVVEDQRNLNPISQYVMGERVPCRQNLMQTTRTESTYETSTVGRWVTDLTAREDRKLALDLVRSLLRWCHDVQCTHTLSIQPGVLRETLQEYHNKTKENMSDTLTKMNELRGGRHEEEKRHSTYLTHQHGHTFLDEPPHRPRVLVQISAREALVRTVEERVVVLLQQDVADLLPLLLCGVDARRVVCTRVQEKYRAVWRGVEGIEELLEREAVRFRVPVLVIHVVDAYVVENGAVVR